MPPQRQVRVGNQWMRAKDAQRALEEAIRVSHEEASSHGPQRRPGPSTSSATIAWAHSAARKSQGAFFLRHNKRASGLAPAPTIGIPIRRDQGEPMTRDSDFAITRLILAGTRPVRMRADEVGRRHGPSSVGLAAASFARCSAWPFAPSTARRA